MRAVLAALVFSGLFGVASYGQLNEAKAFDPSKFKEYKAKAGQGYAWAQFALGACYTEGKGVRKDVAEAVNWFRKAADQGEAGAQANLGACYASGYGVKQDDAEGYAWLDLAAKADEKAASGRDRLAGSMTAQDVRAGKKRAAELREQIEARLKRNDG